MLRVHSDDLTTTAKSLELKIQIMMKNSIFLLSKIMMERLVIHKE